jgi:hypothetical protein
MGDAAAIARIRNQKSIGAEFPVRLRLTIKPASETYQQTISNNGSVCTYANPAKTVRF